MTALCYFNALRELGGARRSSRMKWPTACTATAADDAGCPAGCGVHRSRNREPLELTSRVSTDDVAEAKARLERVSTALTTFRWMWRSPPT